MRVLTCFLVLVVTTASFAQEVADATKPENVKVVPKAGPHDWLVKHKTIVRLVQLTNEHRVQMGVHPVVLDVEMCLAAQRHAKWMAEYGSFQHSGLPYMEIIYQSVQTPEHAIQGWVASPPHHGIMISTATRVGFGYSMRNGYPYWVGVFR